MAYKITDSCVACGTCIGEGPTEAISAGAGTAGDALIGIDDIDIAGRDRFGRGLADAGAAGKAGIRDFVSHFC